MRLILTADLHLGSALTTNFNTEQARIRSEEIMESFEKLVKSCVCNNVAGMILAGDVFDTPHPPAVLLRRFLTAIKDAPRVRFFVLPGNHDTGVFDSLMPSGTHDLSAFSGATLPANVCLMQGGKAYSFGRTVLYAAQTASELRQMTFLRDTVNILVMHGTVSGVAAASSAGAEVGSASADVMARTSGGFVFTDGTRIPFSEIVNRGLDLLALGHIHESRIFKLDKRLKAAYPGSPECRGFDELGPKGVCVYDTDSKNLNFIRTGKRTCVQVTVNVQGIETMPDLKKRILLAASEANSRDLLLLKLVGTWEGDANRVPTRTETESLIADSFYAVRVDVSGVQSKESPFRVDVSGGRKVTTVHAPAAGRKAMSERNSGYVGDNLSLRTCFKDIVSVADLSLEEKRAVIRLGLAALDGRDELAALDGMRDFEKSGGKETDDVY